MSRMLGKLKNRLLTSAVQKRGSVAALALVSVLPGFGQATNSRSQFAREKADQAVVLQLTEHGFAQRKVRTYAGKNYILVRNQTFAQNLPFRLDRGAYQSNPGLATYLKVCTPRARAAFYAQVQTADPDRVAVLQSLGLLLEADLGLRAKVAALTRA